MAVTWYDSIDEKWRQMPKPPVVATIHEPAEDQYVIAARSARNMNIWSAVVATSTATHIVAATKEEPCF